MNILYVIIWLAGIVPSYLIIKWSMKKPGRIWTKLDRTLATLMALFSWAGVFAGLLTHFIFRQKNLNEPSKW